MTTIRLDRNHEKNKEELIGEGIIALNLKLNRQDITRDNLGLFLYTKDPGVISKDSALPWQEFLDDGYPEKEDKEGIRNLNYSKNITTEWLTKIGWKELNRRWPDISLVNYLVNFQDYWADLIQSCEGKKDENYYKPSALQWALYLTIRGPIPDSFPINGIFTYAILKWANIRERVLREVDKIPDGWNNPKANEVANKVLITTLRGLQTSAETYIAKEDGTYPELLRARKLKKYSTLVSLDTIEE